MQPAAKNCNVILAANQYTANVLPYLKDFNKFEVLKK